MEYGEFKISFSTDFAFPFPFFHKSYVLMDKTKQIFLGQCDYFTKKQS